MKTTKNGFFKKQLFTSAAYLIVAMIIAVSIIFTSGDQSSMTARKSFDDITEGAGSVIQIEEGEVPLGTAPQVKTSKKTTTKKKKLKKAAKKSKITTKVSTATKTKKTTSSTKQIVEVTTVKTTVKTSTKKRSKIQKIQTTILTTVSTSENNLTGSAASVSVGGASSRQFAVSKISDIQGVVDSDVYKAFTTLGFTFQVDPSISSTGVFSVKNHWIKLKTGRSNYLLHELGHFAAAIRENADETSEWKSIYSAEKAKFSDSNKAYVTKDPNEYFAESFRQYTEDPSALKAERPRTFTYINKTVNEISDSDVKAFEDAYGWYWNK